eukprot:GHVS01106279.1.p1 GENE.GHVS01106279.1~~GHVS01106279.1.p1  ORF type:complete len:681 (-),score=138.01 GHVS01106279.1:327-2369(-)
MPSLGISWVGCFSPFHPPFPVDSRRQCDDKPRRHLSSGEPKDRTTPTLAKREALCNENKPKEKREDTGGAKGMLSPQNSPLGTSVSPLGGLLDMTSSLLPPNKFNQLLLSPPPPAASSSSSSTPSCSSCLSPWRPTCSIAVNCAFCDQQDRDVNSLAVLCGAALGCRGGGGGGRSHRAFVFLCFVALVAVAFFFITAVNRTWFFSPSSSAGSSFTSPSSFSTIYAGNKNLPQQQQVSFVRGAAAAAPVLPLLFYSARGGASMRLLSDSIAAAAAPAAAAVGDSKKLQPASPGHRSTEGTVEEDREGERRQQRSGGRTSHGPKGGAATKKPTRGGGGAGTPSDESQDCYYLYIEMLLFVLVDILAMQQVAKIFRINCQRDYSMPPVSLTGGKTRTFFIILLVLANLARAVSLGFLGYLLSHPPEILQTTEGGGAAAAAAAADQHQWLLTILRSAPSLLFLSTYSVVILFWAQVYYAAILVSLPLLKPCFVFINIAAYTVYLSAVVLSYLLQTYAELATYAAFLIGIFYTATALGVAYYGVKVSNKLSERSKQPSRKNSIIRRVLFLAIVCPVAFLLRGLYSLAFAVDILPHFYPSSVTHPAWDALIFLVTEWLPSIMILAAFWHRKVSRSSINSAIPSSSFSSSSSVRGVLTNNDYTTPLVESGYSPYAITQHMPQHLRLP